MLKDCRSRRDSPKISNMVWSPNHNRVAKQGCHHHESRLSRILNCKCERGLWHYRFAVFIHCVVYSHLFISMPQCYKWRRRTNWKELQCMRIVGKCCLTFAHPGIIPLQCNTLLPVCWHFLDPVQNTFPIHSADFLGQPGHQLFYIPKMDPTHGFFQLRVQIIVTRTQIWAVGWVGEGFPSRISHEGWR